MDFFKFMTPSGHNAPETVPDTRTTVLRVDGMDCSEEVKAIQDAFQGDRDVIDLQPNLVSGTLRITHTEVHDDASLISTIRKAGLKAKPSKAVTTSESSANRFRLWSVVLSGFLAFVGFLLKFLPAERIAAFEPWIFSAAIVSGGWFIFPKALRAFRMLSPDMNALMTVAVLGAAGIGEWGEAAVVTFLFALSELLESLSVGRARKAIQSLVSLSPQRARVQRNSGFEEVDISQIQPGDVIQVRSGERIPLDGEVIKGFSSVNEAPITGESIPVDKVPGNQVFGATVNGDGSLEIKVTKRYDKTTLANIIHLVEQAQSQKAPAEKFVDAFARYYTPSVLALAVVIFLAPPLLNFGTWEHWFYRALVLLVIACPCALVISTPVSIVCGLTALARQGVLVKGGVFLETIGKVKAVAFDKTGTFTEGQPKLAEIHPIAQRAEDEILGIAASIDRHSTHPLAKAVVKAAEDRRLSIPSSENYQARQGLGAEASIQGHQYFVGNHRMAHDLNLCSEELENRLSTIEKNGQTVIVVGHYPHDDCEGEIVGVLAMADIVRANAANAVDKLKHLGIRALVMLSGDNQRVVDSIAQKTGLTEAHGGLLPDQKVQRIQSLIQEHRYVAMCGDGVNDAPALAAASVGIAMGAAGTDTAIETADVALMKDDLMKLPDLIHTGRRALRMIQFNIAFALAIKALFLILAVGGYASLWLAILADTGATLLVIANAMRLLRTRQQRLNNTG